MFNQNQINHIRKSASVHKVSPDKELWLKLESKLTEKKLHGTIKKYRKLLIAACSIFILSFTFMVNFYKSNNTNRSEFEYQTFMPSDQHLKNEQYNGLYSVRQIVELKEAYHRLGFDSKS